MRIQRLALIGVILVSCVSVRSAFTQPQPEQSDDEAAIRRVIAGSERGQRVPTTADAIFWSGAFQKPVIGDEKPVEVVSPRSPSKRVPGSARGKSTIVRLEVAKAGDMAYEFSTGDLGFKLQDGSDVSLSTSLLRVWRKEGGQWKVAAWFARPHETERALKP